MTHCIPEGTLYPIKGKFVDSSVAAVKPLDSTWARNPIPDHHVEHPRNLSALEFPAPCHDDTSGPTDGLCSGERPFHIAIVDVLQIPTDIPAGDYVVGWRWGE